jgi:ABC-type uncharacterized transport system ATPase subunit
VKDLSLTVRPGEIVGIWASPATGEGLVEARSGGAVRRGPIRVDSRPYRATRAKSGTAFSLPEEPLKNCVPGMSVAQNAGA